MTALPGTIDEWAQDELGRWFRKDHPEDGIITLREGLTFADYWNRRARVWTQDELNAAEVEALFSRQNDIIKALGTVCLQLGNQVRALQAHTGLTRAELKALEAANAVTAEQFRQYVKGLM